MNIPQRSKTNTPLDSEVNSANGDNKSAYSGLNNLAKLELNPRKQVINDVQNFLSVTQ